MLSSTTSSRSGLSPDIPEDTEKSMFSPCNSKQQKSVEIYHTSNGQKDGKGFSFESSTYTNEKSETRNPLASRCHSLEEYKPPVISHFNGIEDSMKKSASVSAAANDSIDTPVISPTQENRTNPKTQTNIENHISNNNMIEQPNEIKSDQTQNAGGRKANLLNHKDVESVMFKEPEKIAPRLKYHSPLPPATLVGDDGTTILVKDVSPKIFASKESNSLKTKDTDSDSCIGRMNSGGNKKSWLLRLFESKLFDASMAISYTFNSKEPGVLGYIGNRLFTYSNSEVDFYLPQLVSMYIMSHEVAEVIHPYIVYRCRNSVDFSLRCAWLLDAYAVCDGATSGSKKKAQHGTKLKNLILSGELVPKGKCSEKDKLQKQIKTIYTHSQTSTSISKAPGRRTIGHVRSRSDASGLLSSEEGKSTMMPFTTATFLPHHATAATVGTNNCHFNHPAMLNKSNLMPPMLVGGAVTARHTTQLHPKLSALLQRPFGRNQTQNLGSAPGKPKLTLGDLTSGRAFDNGCTCFETCKAAVNDLCGRKTHCTCGAPRLAPQQEFIHALLSIGKKLGALQTNGGGGTVSQNKEAKTQRLLAELSMLNLNLPARAWIPIHSDMPHHIVRVPPQAATVLNSKDRAPYIIYVECIEVSDVATCRVPQKIVNASMAGSCYGSNASSQGTFSRERDGRDTDCICHRSKSEERLKETSADIGTHINSEEVTSSSGCGTASASTGDSTSSSSPGATSSTAAVPNPDRDTSDSVHHNTAGDSNDSVGALRLGTSMSTVSLPVMMLPSFQPPGSIAGSGPGSGGAPDIDCWSQEDDELTLQYPEFRSLNSVGYGGSKSSSLSRRDFAGGAAPAPDTISMMSIESTDSSRTGGFSGASTEPTFIAAGDIRRRLSESLKEPKGFKGFKRDPDDPSASVLKEPWEVKVARIRESSPYGQLPNWKLLACIVKCGDDLRQELLAYQLLETLQRIWKEERVPLWVRPYRILVVSNGSGLIEPILNTISLHQIKKYGQQAKLGCDASVNQVSRNGESSSNGSQSTDPSSFTLLSYFLKEFGASTTEQFMEAQRNFVQSCAAYCLVSYLIQVKDRHNGNILLDNEGHLIHIDYGFILSASPKNLGFESSPFKLTPEFVEVMGGQGSDMFEYFKLLILQGLIAARKHSEKIVSLVDIMRAGSQLPCFTSGSGSSAQVMKSRFHMNMTEEQLHILVNTLVEQSINSLTTKLYDGFQYYTNGIL